MLARKMVEKLPEEDQNELLEALRIIALGQEPEAKKVREALIKCELLEEENRELAISNTATEEPRVLKILDIPGCDFAPGASS